MIGKYLKIFLGAAFLGLAVWNFYLVNIGYGLMALFASAISVLLLFKNEMIIVALWHMRKQNMEKSIKALNRIKQPQHLMRSQEAYWYYLKGITGAQQHSMSETEKYFRKALNLGLKNDIDKAIIKMNMATFAMTRRRKREATNLLAEAKKLDKNGMLDEQIKMIKKNMGRI